MKRKCDIACMFEKYEAKNKAASPSPSLVAADPEEQIEEQEDKVLQDHLKDVRRC